MSVDIGQELLNAPFPEMVRNLGIGIAQAQFELDKVSMNITRMMAGVSEDGTQDSSQLIEFGKGADKESYSLLALGFMPTFYQFVDTMIELKMDFKMKTENKNGGFSFNGKAGFLSVAMVGASYSQKYQFSAEGSSLMRTKLVTVPSPPILEEIIRAKIIGTPPTP